MVHHHRCPHSPPRQSVQCSSFSPLPPPPSPLPHPPTPFPTLSLNSEVYIRNAMFNCTDRYISIFALLIHTLTHTHTHTHTHTYIHHTHNTRTLTHTHMYTVSGFSYYQFYCFQNTQDLFDNFDSNSTTITDFLNRTESLTNTLCVQTQVFRTFISSQLPWFRYQKETWLAIGELYIYIYMYIYT